MRKTLLILVWTICATMAWAQKLIVKAPSHVPAGETFRLEYTIHTTNVRGGLQLGNIPNGLEVVFGPSESRMESFSTTNGHTSSSSVTTITYMLVGNANGTYTIPPARIDVGGRTITSSAVRVTISGASRQNKKGGTKFYEEEQDDARPRAAGSQITDRDLFIKVTANKTRVYEQEPVLLTYKVYTLVDLTQLEGSMPDLNGFHSQALPLPQQKNFTIENINGRNYRCATWSRYIMYPQMTGKLEIPSITFKGIVVQENRNVDPYEAFLNGGSGYIEVKRNIKAPGLTLQVDPLPDKPQNFSGGVGRFHISATADKKEVNAGDPITVRVVVSGIGNLKLVKQPQVRFAKDFDTFEPKITDKTHLTMNGVEGSMIYDFPVIPRNVGNYSLPSVELVYYDTRENRYKTVRTAPIAIKVLKGNGTSDMSDFSNFRDQDIQGIKTGETTYKKPGEMFFGSVGYLISVLLPIGLFLVLVSVFRKRALENADLMKKRGKNADKVAGKRLRVARRLMTEDKTDAFYDEVLRALWGYVGDKLGLPVEELSRDNIVERLSGKDVQPDTVSLFMAALDECEYARYAPESAAGNMQRTFEAAMKAIMQIENTMKKRKESVSRMVLMAIPLFLLWWSMPVHGVTKVIADSEYSKGNYIQAIHDYTALLKNGESAELFYNLGNAYYRTDNITRAVLFYERALLLSPGDDDIRFNLSLARTKTIDKITPVSEMFFVTWYRMLVNSRSVDSWAFIAIVSIVLVLLSLPVYLFGRQLWLRKIGFFGALCFLLVFLFSNLFAYQLKQKLDHRTGAIIMTPTVAGKKTPSGTAASVFVLHEGTKVEVTDDTMKGWKYIRLADGREGWMESRHLEMI